MVQASRHRPFNYEGPVRFQVIIYEICGGKNDNETGFYPKYFDILFQCHFTNVSYSFHRRYMTSAADSLINPLNTKRRLLYLKTQFVPRSKHFSSR